MPIFHALLVLFFAVFALHHAVMSAIKRSSKYGGGFGDFMLAFLFAAVAYGVWR